MRADLRREIHLGKLETDRRHFHFVLKSRGGKSLGCHGVQSWPADIVAHQASLRRCSKKRVAAAPPKYNPMSGTASSVCVNLYRDDLHHCRFLLAGDASEGRMSTITADGMFYSHGK